jgi:hypothetical protein
MEIEGASIASASGKKRRPALPLLSVTPPSIAASANSVSTGGEGQRSRGSSLGSVKMFLQHSPTASLLHLPTFGTPSNGDGSGRRFSFSLRRFSSQVNLLCTSACLPIKTKQNASVSAAPDPRLRDCFSRVCDVTYFIHNHPDFVPCAPLPYL